MPNAYALLGALVGAVALAVSSFFYGQHVESNAWQAKMAQAQETARKQWDDKLAQANARADELEKKNVAIRANTRVVTRTVDRIVTQPLYSRECIDASGMRAVRDALGLSAPDAASSPTALSGSPAPGGRDGSLDPAHAH